jgi:hypothetical protein
MGTSTPPGNPRLERLRKAHQLIVEAEKQWLSAWNGTPPATTNLMLIDDAIKQANDMLRVLVENSS